MSMTASDIARTIRKYNEYRPYTVEGEALLACARLLVERQHGDGCEYLLCHCGLTVPSTPHDDARCCTCGLREIADALGEGTNAD
jgi:hypothetical protein